MERRDRRHTPAPTARHAPRAPWRTAGLRGAVPALGAAAAIALGALTGCSAAAAPTVETAPAEDPLAGATRVSLADGASTVEGPGATVDGDAVAVSAGGTYVLAGSLGDGSVVVDAPGEEVVLVLDGVDLGSTAAAAVQVDAAASVAVELAEGSENAVRHTGTADGEDGGCVRSAADLSVRGEGSLSASSDAGDCLYSDGDLTLEGGTCELSAGDDGAHAEGALTVSGGSHTVTGCTEGLEGAQVVVTGGEVDVTSSDDGVNASGEGDDLAIGISGGTVRVTAGGDGLDSNGSLTVSGGEVIVACVGEADGALDYETDCSVTGGTLVAAGGGMPAVPTECGQPVVAVGFGSEVAADTAVTLSRDGADDLSFTLPAASTYAVVSGPDVVAGETYTVTWEGGSAEAAVADGSVTRAGSSVGGPGGAPGGAGAPEGGAPEPPSGDGAGAGMPGGEPPAKPEGDGEPPTDAPEPPDGAPGGGRSGSGSGDGSAAGDSWGGTARQA